MGVDLERSLDAFAALPQSPRRQKQQSATYAADLRELSEADRTAADQQEVCRELLVMKLMSVLLTHFGSIATAPFSHGHATFAQWKPSCSWHFISDVKPEHKSAKCDGYCSFSNQFFWRR
jgi:hypothetical protein